MAETKRVALVTGGSTGIGRAIAERLVKDGLRVFGTSRNPEGGEGGVEIVPLDVGNSESVRACIDTVIARAGAIDVLVNNAGFLQSGAIEEVSIDEAKAQFETNFFGAVRTIHAVLPGMRTRGSGQIVNITSLAGLVPLPFWGFYNASKAALDSLTETLRHEVQPFGISVSAIEPGAIKTPFYTIDRRPSGLEVYKPWQDRFTKRMAEFEKAAPGPELVADTVSRVVGARSPALRYPVTREAQLFTRMQRWFPESWFAYGIRSGFRLDDARY